jgi:hypothetical protein
MSEREKIEILDHGMMIWISSGQANAGAFVKRLAFAWIVADPTNRAIIAREWAHYWESYAARYNASAGAGS